jgi:glutathione S-transferase
MLKLYTARNSICTQKVFITLYEKGLDWEEVIIDLFNNEQYRPEYLRINPKGVVPSLVHNGDSINESTLICEYLDEVVPEPSLRPAAAANRARMRIWSKFIDEGIFEATREISFSAMFREKMRNMSAEQREGRFRNVGNPEKRARFVSTYEEGVESPYVLYGIAHYEKMFAAMEKDLADGRDWLVGGSFSLADIALMPFVARMDYLDLLDVWTEGRSGVTAWWARAKARPSFAHAVSSRLKPEEEKAMRTFGGALKERIRERRQEYLRTIS